MQTMQVALKKLREVNARLKHGEGWIGYRYSKNPAGEKVPSRFLYYAFYRGAQQKFVNSKTNNPEDAYRQLLVARNQVREGNRILPSDVSRLRYEDLRQILMDYYREKHPASMYARPTKGGGTEETFSGADALDRFFKRMPISEITALKIQSYVKWQRNRGISGPTVRRQLGRLRSAFNRAKDLDLITDNHIPSFNLPEDSKANQGFLDLEDFLRFRAELPKDIQPATTFLYYTGCRIGAAEKITWSMVSKNCDEIEIAGEITKTREPLTIPLVGPLEEIANMLREIRKTFPKPNDPVLCFTNFRKAWNTTCHRLGLGVFDAKTGQYEGLKPHDLRRSAARNLIKAGVDRRTAMKITGHKTEHIFERYNIKTTDDVKEALLKVGQYKKVAVTEIGTSPSSAR
jgi:integrase